MPGKSGASGNTGSYYVIYAGGNDGMAAARQDQGY
jgi:hypothetical protein